jgi:anaerobic C4-dicarboxylate transporter DcuA/anaerobic C4-dicarboxylate transporter DcuB
MSRHGTDLEQDAEYQRRLQADLVTPPKASTDIQLMPYAKRSVAIFLGAVLVICIFGLFEGIRPTVAAEEGGGLEPLAVTPIIQMVMLTAGALILLLCKVRTTDIPGTAIFKSGMVAMIALFGIA